MRASAGKTDASDTRRHETYAERLRRFLVIARKKDVQHRVQRPGMRRDENVPVREIVDGVLDPRAHFLERLTAFRMVRGRRKALLFCVLGPTLDDFVPRQAFPRAEIEFAPSLVEHDRDTLAYDGARGIMRAL